MLGDSVRRRQPQGRGRGPRDTRARGTRRPGGWKPFLMALPFALMMPAGIGYLLAVFVLFPPTQESSGGIPVPSLVGQSASDAQRSLAAVGLGEIEADQLPHPTAPSGQVVAQSPLAGQQLRPGATVRVALSAGPPRALVPDIAGFSAERAESLLRRAGFDVTVVRQESSAPAGRVLRTDPAAGQERMLPSAVTIVVSEGPPAPAVDTTAVPPDTMRVQPDSIAR